ncbi:MAG: formylglycine-generating enzyme family protein [Desulfobacteraceae bacterium]|nr:formylglycine-generating enzyme family protein [Desulfobacteraceae bacterium]
MTREFCVKTLILCLCVFFVCVAFACKQGNGNSIPEKIKGPFGMEFVYIKPGTFTMGSPESEKDRERDEKQHQVTLTKGFYMQTTEVTLKHWKKTSFYKDCNNKCPVTQVSWDDVQEFIKKLNQMEKTDVYRLPTEAEWEYAARAGTTTAFSWGNEADCSKANYGASPWSKECKNPGKIMPAASFQPNSWGLYDMHGNVWEWCQDSCDWKSDKGVITDTYKDGVTDPVNTKGPTRIYRGGSWSSNGQSCRLANRNKNLPDYIGINLGFRVLREVKQ